MSDLRIPILALGHRSRVGKDTVARAITNVIAGAERVAFADHLKSVACQLFGRYGLRGGEFYEERPELRSVTLPLMGKTPVEVWVDFGCAMRAVHSDLWVDVALNQTRLNPIRLLVVSDLRFPNEAKRVRELGGWCVKVERPGGGVVNGSDDEFPEGFQWDRVIVNDGSLDDLRQDAETLALDYLHAITGGPG